VGLSDWFFGAITRRLYALEVQGDLLLATVQELQQKIDNIGVAVDAERVEVQGLLLDLRTQIQALQDQLGAGQLVTQEQLDGLAVAADAIVARVQAISEPV
jgi:hypothetical protein